MDQKGKFVRLALQFHFPYRLISRRFYLSFGASTEEEL
jgi:hypothetical protein